MSNDSLARSGQKSTVERINRGRALFEAHGAAIMFLENDVWSVPTSNGSGEAYLVNLRTERCDCRDFEHRAATCKHIVAATIARAKSVTCSCCRERVLGRFTSEVTDDDELLSWFAGDVLCAGCIRRGFWV